MVYGGDQPGEQLRQAIVGTRARPRGGARRAGVGDGAFPAVTAVQRAALKELLIAVALILVLRLMPSGLLPERIPRAPQPGGRS